MRLEGRCVLLRVFIGESDHYGGKPLYQAILEKARALGLSGGTVFKGMLGFGAHSKIHTAKILRLSEDLPVVVEIVDTEENVEKILPFLDAVIKEGLITKEVANVVFYRPDGPKG
jgi:hypothetical protein